MSVTTAVIVRKVALKIAAIVKDASHLDHPFIQMAV